MSLIHSCELNGPNPFEYLIVFQRDATDLARNPSAWMLWNYGETLGGPTPRSMLARHRFLEYGRKP